jgi:small subunit ribosomal protein S16
MAVKIRLSRKGRKKMPIYDIVVADVRAPRDGKFIEKIGQYNPNNTPASLNLRGDRALHWLMVGAQPTDTARKILSVEGIMYQKHLQVGVVKGAITQEVADEKFTAWLKAKEEARIARVAKLNDSKSAVKKAALDAERKKKEGVLAKKEQAEQAIIAAAEANAKAMAAATAEAAKEVAAEVEGVVEEVVAEAEGAIEKIAEVIAPSEEAPASEEEPKA